MKNTLADINNYLFEVLERLTDENLTDEQLQKEIIRSQAVTNVIETIMRSSELALKTMIQLNEYGIVSYDKVPSMLEIR